LAFHPALPNQGIWKTFVEEILWEGKTMMYVRLKMVTKDWLHEFGAGFTSGLAAAIV
jgi:hypothetical protein